MKTTRIMNKIIIYLSAVLLLCSCGSARHYAAFQYDVSIRRNAPFTL